MLQRNVPDRESLILCISCLNSSFIVMIKLGEAGCHLSASRSGCRDNYQRSGRLNILVLSVAFITHNERNVGRIAFYCIMQINLYILLFKLFLECNCSNLSSIMSQYHTSHIKTAAFKFLHQSLHIFIICDSKISAYLILFNIGSIYDDYNLRSVRKLHQHAELTVRLKARQHPRCMKIIKQLTSEFKIQFVPKFTNSFLDMLRLHL